MSVAMRGLNKIRTVAQGGSEADYHRKLLDDIVEVAGVEDLVFFLPNFESNPADDEDITDYGLHGLHFQAHKGAGGNWAVPPTIRGSVLRYRWNGTDEAADHADNDLFSMGADGTAPNEPSFSLAMAAKFGNVASGDVLIARFDQTTLAEEVEFQLFLAGGSLIFRMYDEVFGVFIGRRNDAILESDVWYVVIATYDGSRVNGGFRIFIDGIRADTANSGAGAYTAMHNTAVVTSVGYREAAGGALVAFFEGDWYGVLQTARRLSDGGAAEGAVAGGDVAKMTALYGRLLGI